MKLVWVTGIRGFLGRHVARYFAEKRFEVGGIDRVDWPAEERSKWGVQHWVRGGVTDSSLARLAILSGLPRIVFHAAGTGSVGQSYEDPIEDFKNNVCTTAEVLDFLRREAAGAIFILPSSAAVYGTKCPGPIRENSELRPVSPYGYHKLMAEQLCKSAGLNFGLRSIVIRYFSLYGPGLQKQLLWDLAAKVTSNPQYVELFGTGNETRDMFYIEDAVRLPLEVLRNTNEKTVIVNGGSGKARSVRDIALTLIRHLNVQAEPRFNNQCRRGDPVNLEADMTVARSLGYEPKWSLERGMAEYVRWLKSTKKDK